MQVCIKVVVFDSNDLEYAMEVYNYMPETHYDSFYLSAGTLLQEPPSSQEQEVVEANAMHRLLNVIQSQRALADTIVDMARVNRFNKKFHIGCQQHVLMWPEIDQGV